MFLQSLGGQPISNRNGNGKRIPLLAVSSSPELLEQLKRMLEGIDSHFDVLTAGDSDCALEAFGEIKENLGLLITERLIFSREGENGVNLIKKCFIRGRKTYPTIVILSPMSESVDDVRAEVRKVFGMTGDEIVYLQKLYGRDDLIGALEKALPRKIELQD